MPSTTTSASLTNPNDLLAALPLVGYLGLGDNVARSPGSLLVRSNPQSAAPWWAARSLNLGSFNPATLLGGAVDPSTLTTDLSRLLQCRSRPHVNARGGVDPSTLTTDLSGLLLRSRPHVMLGLDPSTLTTDLSTLLPNEEPTYVNAGGALDPTTLTTDLSGLLPGVGTDLASMLGGGLATDLSSLLWSSAGNVIPDLALQLLTAI